MGATCSESVLDSQNLLLGDCLEMLPTLPANSIDAIVCDPPYGLNFMGKSWDHGIPGVLFWEAALGVAKPGAYLLAFGGTRTFHRLTCAIEDAGWVIKDCLSWTYGSGFPKSHDISKAIDKKNGKHEIDLSAFGEYIKKHRKAKGWSLAELDERMGTTTAASWWEGRKSGVQLPSKKTYEVLKGVLGLDNAFDFLIDWAEAEREVVGKGTSTLIDKDGTYAITHGESSTTWNAKSYDITAPATDQAKEWEGFGTALKPSWEPIILAQKPVEGTYAENVLKWGVGGLNIDGCRIGTETMTNRPAGNKAGGASLNMSVVGMPQDAKPTQSQGRWPANTLLSHTIFCEMVGEKRVKGTAPMGKPCRGTVKKHPIKFGSNQPLEFTDYADSNGKETVEDWNCHPECAIAILNSQSNNAARFFKTFEPDAMCWLCEQEIMETDICENANNATQNISPIDGGSASVQASARGEQSQGDAGNQGQVSTNVPNVTRDLQNTQAITEGIAPQNAAGLPKELFAQAVKSAGRLCGKCTTPIALALAEPPKASIKTLQAGLGSIKDFKRSILIPSLAMYVEIWGNTDTTQIIQNLSTFFGFVRHATEGNINSESHSGNGSDAPTRFSYNPKASRSERNAGLEGFEEKDLKELNGDKWGAVDRRLPSGSGSVGKTKNHHPTVKPIKLLRYLCRLITPPNGTVLDMFMGSGSTGCAVVKEGFRFIGIEKESEYHEIARARIEHAKG